MPRKCCVPGCRANYNSQKGKYINTFSFPKEPNRRERWIRAIRRDGFIPGSCSAVCIDHFCEHFVKREDRSIRKNGSLLIVPRKFPKLTDDACPSIFPGRTSKPAKRRKLPAKRRDTQKPSSSGKETGLISYTNPGPSTSQENLLVEPEDLIFVKEEPYVSDNEQQHYETAFVDFSATESYRHDELSGSSYGGAPIPETYYGVDTESNVEPSDAQQSGHVIEKAVSLAAGQAHDSKRRSTQDSSKQDNVRSCDEKEQDKTSCPTETNGNNTKSHIRVMELTLEQLKKEHKAKMKEHEANMREHETRMSNHEKITEMQLDIMKKEHDMKIAEIEFRYQDLKKKSDWDGKVHKLTIMNLQQKLSTCQLEHQEKSKLHELVVQELQQKLTNSQLEHRILLKKLKELDE